MYCDYVQNMKPLRYEEYFETLISLVESGEIPMSRIDDAVKRILRVKLIADRSLLDMVGCKVLFSGTCFRVN